MVFVMDDTLSILRPIHLPVLQTRMKNMLPMQEFALDYFERLVKIDLNLDISLEVSTLFKTYYMSAVRMVVFYFFSMVPSGKPNSPLLFLQKSNIEKKDIFGKLMKTI